MLRSWIRAALAEKKEDPLAKEEARGLCVLLGCTPQASLRETLVLCRQKAAGMQLDLSNARRDLHAARKKIEVRAEMIDKLTKKIVAARKVVAEFVGSDSTTGDIASGVYAALDANDEEVA